MKRGPRVGGVTVALVLILVALLALDAQRARVAVRLVAQLRFGSLTPVAREYFAQASATAPIDTLVGGLPLRRMYAAAARTARPVSGGRVGDTLYVDYATSLRWCSLADEPNDLQVRFVRDHGRWRAVSAEPFPC